MSLMQPTSAASIPTHPLTKMNPYPPVLVATLLAANLAFAQNSGDSGPLRPYSPPEPIPELTAPPGAEAQEATRLSASRTAIHTAAADMGLEYGVWATGDDYKVSFHDGMTFIPYLGSDYPVTQSFGWSTKSVMLGSTELLAEMTAQRARGSWRYEYEYGTVTEAYDVLHEGLEQTFVLHAKPAVGDLVIRGRVASNLHCERTAAAHQSLMFSDGQGREILNYGAGIAFDANGSRVDVQTSFTNGEVTLTVPRQWIEHAALPITVDPLLTPVLVESNSEQSLDHDIGRDDRTNLYTLLTVHTRYASASDTDLFARLRTEDYALSADVFVDVTSNWNSLQGTCAYVGGVDRWAIVFSRYFPNATIRSSRLRCHLHDSADTSLGTNFGSLNPAPGINDWRPDTGGIEAFASGSNAFVVFQREDNTATNNHFANTDYSKVCGCLLDATTPNGSFGAPFEIAPSNLHDCERPSVNQVAEGGPDSGWICMHQRFLVGLSNEDWDLVGKRVAADGTIAGGTWYSDMATVSPKQHQLAPKIEGSRGRYAVLFTTADVATYNFKTMLAAGTHVQIERFNWSANAFGPSADYPTETLRSGVDRRWEVASLAFDTVDRSHWVALYRSVPPGAGYLYYTRVGYTGASLFAPVNPVVYANVSYQATPGAVVFNDDNDTFALFYGANHQNQPNSLYCRTLTYDSPIPAFTSGTSCSSATLSWVGSQQIGSEFCGPRVQGAPPGAIHIMLAATATTNVPVLHPIVFPGCNLFVMAAGPGYLGAFPTSIGSSYTWDLPLPEFLGSQTLHFQDWHLNANGLLYSTERLSVPIIK